MYAVDNKIVKTINFENRDYSNFSAYLYIAEPSDEIVTVGIYESVTENYENAKLLQEIKLDVSKVEFKDYTDPIFN